MNNANTLKGNYPYTVKTIGPVLKENNLPYSRTTIYGLIKDGFFEAGEQYINVSRGATPRFRFNLNKVIEAFETPVHKR